MGDYFMKDIPGTKYITQAKNGQYRVAKKINGKSIQFGTYDKLETAIYYRDYFQKKGWENCLSERTLYTDTRHKRLHDKSMRCIRKSGSHYRIDKELNKTKYNFGTYDTIDEAIFFRDYFEENNWPVDERLKYTNAPTFISGNSKRGYEVRKIINGDCLHMGCFKDYDEAAGEVELYKKYNWDLEKICTCPDETENGVKFLDGKHAKESFFKKNPNGVNDFFWDKHTTMQPDGRLIVKR